MKASLSLQTLQLQPAQRFQWQRVSVVHCVFTQLNIHIIAVANAELCLARHTSFDEVRRVNIILGWTSDIKSKSTEQVGGSRSSLVYLQHASYELFTFT